MKVSVYLKASKETANRQQQSNICFRVREKGIDIKSVSELTVIDKYWDEEAFCYKRTSAISQEERRKKTRLIADIIEQIESSFNPNTADGVWLKQTIEDAIYPQRAYERSHPSFLKIFERYLEHKKDTTRSVSAFVDFQKKIMRYQQFKREVLGEHDFTLFVEKLTMDDMIDFREFISNEHLLREEYPEFYSQYPKPRKGVNGLSNTTIVNVMNQYCMFLHWCKQMRYTDSNLFLQYGTKLPVHGDPFFLTMEEVNILYDADLTDFPKLERTRDVFVFHCYIGCRVGDLVRLTKDNIKDGFLEYMPQKTKKCEAKIVRVPLHDKAKAVLEKYQEFGPKLLPFKYVAYYNQDIRELLKHCGIDRMVTVLDTLGLETVQKPLYEIATSHTARKTFIGNLYKRVPDPNLIASMSGHVEGSRAFKRYRTIDDEMKRQLVDLIN